MKDDFVGIPVSEPSFDVYDRVMELYRTTSIDRNGPPSDTWKLALERKGYSYAREEMENMLTAGSSVSSLILNWSFITDENQLDLKDVYLRKILEFGESDIGNPHKNNLILGKYYSSGFLRNAIVAARLIKALDQKGFKDSLRIMEIGGGTGQLQYILKRYYSDKVTLFSVDLPETLLIQEWYMLSHFPNARYAHKVTNQEVELAEGGLNFINAYCLPSQDFSFDAIVNIASMQEMTEVTVEGYFSFIQKNISSNGLFFFSNCYGHATNSIVSPSDYPFDQYWKIEDVSIAYSSEILVNPGEFFTIIASRTGIPHDRDQLRLVLRYVWNGFQSKHLIRSSINIDTITKKMKEMISDSSNSNTSADLGRLRDHYYLSEDAFYKYADFIPDFQSIVSKDRPEAFVKLTAKTQGVMVNALKEYVGNSLNDSDVVKIKLDLSRRLYDSFSVVYRESDYECRYITAMLIGLGSLEEAFEIVNDRLKHSTSIYQRIHYFYLLLDMQNLQKNHQQLLAVVDQEIPDVLSVLQLCDLCLTCDQKWAFDRHNDLEISKWTDYQKYLLFKLLLKHERYDREDLMLQCLENIHAPKVDEIWGLLFTFGNNLKKNKSLIFVKLKDLLQRCAKDDFGKMLYRCLEDPNPEGLLRKYASDSKDDFFKLGRLAQLLFKYKLDDSAGQCMEESVRLRPANFKHYCYVADVYFANHYHAQAKDYYQKAVAITPYFIHLIYRKFYCDLPMIKQNSGLFTKPDKIDAFTLGYSHSYLSFLK